MKDYQLLKNLVERVSGRLAPRNTDLFEKSDTPRKLSIEALEPRILFSGAPVAAPVDAPAPMEAPAAEAAPIAYAAPVAAPAPGAAAETAPVPTVAGEAVVAAPPEAVLAVETAAVGGDGATAISLTDAEVSALADVASSIWNAAGISNDQRVALASATYQIADLGGNILGSTEGNVVTLDDDAAGRGWFVDPTPEDNGEFELDGSGALTSSSTGGVDLLSVLLHEQGHLLGLDDSGAAEGDIMFETLAEGERRLPGFGDAAGVLPGSLEETHLLTLPQATEMFEDEFSIGSGSASKQTFSDAGSGLDFKVASGGAHNFYVYTEIGLGFGNGSDALIDTFGNGFVNGAGTPGGVVGTVGLDNEPDTTFTIDSLDVAFGDSSGAIGGSGTVTITGKLANNTTVSENRILNFSGGSYQSATFLGQGGALDGADLVSFEVSLSSGIHYVYLDNFTYTATTTTNGGGGNFVAYHDFGATTGQESTGNITTHQSGASNQSANALDTSPKELVDYADGSGTGVFFSVAGANGMDSRNNGETGPPNAGTDADTLFNVAGLNLNNGVIYEGGISGSGATIFTLTGLDPRIRYDLAFYGSRVGQSLDGFEQFTLNGADSATNSSSENADSVIVSDFVTNSQTRPNNIAGNVIRWTDIDPGADGEITITMDPEFASANNIAYLSALRLEATQVTSAGLDAVDDEASTDEDTVLNISAGNDSLDVLAGASTVFANDVGGGGGGGGVAGQLDILDLAANGGINPATGNPWKAGDTYRLAFVTAGTGNATSTDIDVYNSFVQNAANGSSLGLGGATWKVIGSTATVDARDNTSTNPVMNGTGEPIYLTDGTTLFANGYSDLWNGLNAGSGANGFTQLNLNEEGAAVAGGSVFTGTQVSGVKESTRVLGGSGETPPKVTTGRTDSNNSGRWLVQFNTANTSNLPFYALSEVLTVQAASGGTLTLVGSDSTSAYGAAVTVNPDGSFTYDPTGSATIQALNAGDVLSDTFTYTITDGTTETVTLLTEDFESPDITTSQATQNNTNGSEYSRILPDNGNWVGGNQGFGGNAYGIDDEGTGHFSDPGGEQAFAFRYTNSGMTTAEGKVGKLAADTTYTVSFDVVRDDYAARNGVAYTAEFVAFSPGDNRSEHRGARPGTILSSKSGNASNDGQYTSVTFTFTPDGSHTGLIGKDVGLRFLGATTSATIDNVGITATGPVTDTATVTVTVNGVNDAGALDAVDDDLTGSPITEDDIFNVPAVPRAPGLGGVTANLALWLDASDIDGDGNADSILDGTTITNWKDKSGNGHHANVVQSDPGYVASSATLNGKAVVNFDGDDQISLSDDLRASLNDPDGSYTIITVARYTGGQSNRLITVDSGHNWLFGYHGNQTNRWYADGWVNLDDPATGGATDWILHTGRMDGAPADPQGYFYRNGDLQTDTASGNGNANGRGGNNSFNNYAPDKLALGGWNANSEFSKGEVAEVLIYNSLLTDAERIAVETYLSQKYDLGLYPKPSGVLVNDTGVSPAGPVAQISGVTIEDVSSELGGFNRKAVYVIDGSGLNGAGEHGIAPDGSMWLNQGTFGAGGDPLPAHITFDLGENYDLENFHVWNYNETQPNLNKRGANLVEISVASSEGGPFTSLGNFNFAQATGLATYTGETIDLSAFAAADDTRLIRLDIKSNHGGDAQFVGLSEVQFFGGTAAVGDIVSFDATSANGAAVTVNPDGGFTYDPTGSAAIQSLEDGETLTDTFTYTITDGSTVPYSDVVTALNPVAYYTMDEEDVTGSTVANRGSLSNTATLTAGATFTGATGGVFGGGLNVDDNSGHRLTVDSGNIDLGSDWTISVWFNDLHDTAGWRTLVRGEGNDHQVIVENGQNDLGMYSNANGAFRDSGHDLFPGDTAWHHLSAVGNATSNTTTFYIDGVQVGVSDRSSMTDIKTIGNHLTGGQPFAQAIDEFAVFDYALSGEQIATLASTNLQLVTDTATVSIQVNGVTDLAAVDDNLTVSRPTTEDDVLTVGAVGIGIANLNDFATGNYTFMADGQEFEGYVEQHDGSGWLLIGRGRQGWEFDTDGQGNVADVNQGLGTSAAFGPGAYTDAMINDLLAEAGLTMGDVEIRVSRASSPDGTGEYQDVRWRNFTGNGDAFTWNLEDSQYGITTEHVNAPAGLSGAQTGVNTNTNTRDSGLGGNDADRIFTWAWANHNNQKGFSYGSSVGNGSNSPTSFVWENGNENHAIPYTEIYIRSLNGGTAPNTGLFGNDIPTDPTLVSYDTTSANGANVTINPDGSFEYDPTATMAIQALDAGDVLTDTFTYTITASNAGNGSLIGHYPLDEVVGSTTPDSAGTNGDGTLNGAVMLNASGGKIGGAFDIAAGNGNFVGITDAGFGKEAFTASVWFQPDSLGTGDAIANWTNAGSSPRTFLIRTDGNGNLQTFVRSGGSQIGGNNTFATQSISTTQFNHAVIVYDGQTLKTYLNGELSSNAPSFGLPVTLGEGVQGTAAIGGRGSSEGNMDGLVDDVAFWGEMLTGGKIGAVFNLADEMALNYDAGEVNQLFQVFDGAVTDVNIDGLTWTWDTGLGGSAGEVVDIGGGHFFVNLDGTAGVVSSAIGTATVTVTVNGLNDAPVLDAGGTEDMNDVSISDITNNGDLVSDLYATGITDVDASSVEGIAITDAAVPAGTGSFEYSIDGGANWVPVGTVSESSALLLLPTDRVRFVSDGTTQGGGTLTYRAWDQTAATAGLGHTNFDITSTGTGGTTPFSVGAATATAAVYNLVIVGDEIIYTAAAGEENDIRVSMVGGMLVIIDAKGNPVSTGETDGNPDANGVSIAYGGQDLKIDTNDMNDGISFGDMTGFTGSLTTAGGDDFDTITTSGSVLMLDADENVDLDAERIRLLNSVITTTGDGMIAIDGTGGGSASMLGVYEGVKLKGTSLSTENGNITLNGTGGDDATANEGVQLSAGSTVMATGTGSVSVSGQGGTGGSSNTGVSIIENSTVSSGAAGGVSVTGTGGGERDSQGVNIFHGSTVSGGAGGVMITGTSTGTGVRNDGVYTTSSTISASDGGSVTITGTASQSAASGANAIGVRISSGTTVDVTDGGSITLTGTGGTGTSGNEGVHIGQNSALSTEDGDITITGTSSATGANNYGVNFLGGSSAMSGGALTVNGTGGNGNYGNAGVSLLSTMLTSATTLSVTGTGQGTGWYNHGIIGSGSTITGGTGVTLAGTGSQNSTTGYNDGISLSGTSVTATGGMLTMTGIGGTGGSANNGVKVTNGSLSGMLDIDGTGGGGAGGNSNAGVKIAYADLTGVTGGTIEGTGGMGSFYNYGTLLYGNMGGNAATATGTAGQGAASDATVGDYFNFLPALLAVAAAEKRGRKQMLGELMKRISENSEIEPGTAGVQIYREEDGLVRLAPTLASFETLEEAGIVIPAAPEGTRAVILLTGDDHGPLAGFVAYVGTDGELVSSETIEVPAALLAQLNGEDQPRWSSPTKTGLRCPSLSEAFGL